jgi:mannose-6-phosphate isomerase-like protein (cupin superfamily)
MQKNRKKPLDVAGRVDFRARGKFASNVVTSPIPPHSAPGADSAAGAGRSERLATRLFAHGQSLVAVVVLGCQPAPPLAKPEATRFEIPVAHEPEPSATEPGTAPSLSSHGPEANATRPALPRALPPAFARNQTCTQGTCSLPRWLPEASYALSPLEEVSAQAAIWVHGIQPQARLSVPANDALELVVVGLGGELRARDTRPGTSAPSEFRVDPWTALRASGAGIELVCAAGDCRAMLALIAPESTLDAAVGAASVPSAVALAHKPRRVPLELRSFEKVPLLTWQHGKNHARILFGGSDLGSPLPFSLTLLQTLAPALIPPHSHESSWENLLVLEGRGDLELRGRSYPIAGGESLHIGPRVRHGYVASGQESFVALQLYTPAGPEQRFLAAAGAAPTAAAAPTAPPSPIPRRDNVPTATVPP